MLNKLKTKIINLFNILFYKKYKERKETFDNGFNKYSDVLPFETSTNDRAKSNDFDFLNKYIVFMTSFFV